MPSPRLRRTPDHPDVKHGTYVTYMNYRCRCEPCISDYKRYKAEYRARNKARIAAYSKQYYEENREALSLQGKIRSNTDESRATRRARRYGISPAQLAELLATNKCGICGTSNPGAHGWHIDHDHRCCPAGRAPKCGNCIRGILCHKCNVGIGHFDDDLDRLRSAISYLERMD